MNCGIYMITNKLNGNFYVGSSNDFKTRWKTHRNQLNAGVHHSIHLQRAWNKYGEESFEFAGIIELPEDKNILFEKEQILLDQHYGKQYCYNGHLIARGGALPGELNHMYGKTHTDEVKKFLSEINKGKNNYWYDKPEHMVKMRSAITKRFNGRKHTQETREKMSKARKGRKHHADTKKGLARHKKGKSIREEKSKRNQ